MPNFLQFLFPGHVGPEHAHGIAVLPQLRHRVVSNFTAEAEGVKPERIIQDLLKNVPSE